MNGSAVFHIEQAVYIGFEQAVSVYQLLQKLTVLSKLICTVTFFDIVSVDNDKAQAGIQIAIGTEIVLSAVHFYPLTGIESGAVAALHSLGIGYPHRIDEAHLIGRVGNTGNLNGSDLHFLGGGIRIYVLTVNVLPAGYQLAIDQVVDLITDGNQTGSIYNCTVCRTLEKVAVHNVVMAGSFHNRTPVNHGLTSFAVGSAGVTVFGTGGSFFLRSQLCVMGVIGRRNSSQLGNDVDRAAERSLVDRTVYDVALNVYSRLVFGAYCRIILFSQIIVAVVSPDADRDADESTCLCSSTANRLNRNGQQLSELVIGEGCLKAVGNNCTFSFPSVGSLELQNRYQFGHTCKVGNIDIHIIDGLCLGSFTGYVVSGKLDCSFTCNSKGTGELHGIAQLILDLESNGMDTCYERSVFLGREHTADNCSLDLYAIHEDLTGGEIQRNVIRNGCGESDLISVYGSTILQRNCGIGSRISGCTDGRQNSVIYSRAVIQGNVIDVEGNLVGNLRLRIRTDECRRHRTAIGCNGRAYVIVLGNINRCIYPTGFGNICIGCGVQIGLLAGSRRGKHKVLCPRNDRAFTVLHPKVRLEGETGSTAGNKCIFGNINPHTQRSCLLIVCYVAQNNRFADVVQIIIRPSLKIRVGIIKLPGKGVISVSDRAAIGGGAHMSSCHREGVHLSAVRIGTVKETVYDIVFFAPLLGLCIAYEAGIIAVFKIEDDLGALTELDGIDKRSVPVGNGDVNARDRSIGGSGKLEAIQRTCICVGQRYRNGRRIHVHVCLADHCYDGQCERTDFIRRRIRNYGRGGRKLEHFGIGNGDSLGANYLTAGKNLHVYLALLTVGNELAVLNGTKGRIGQSPSCIRRHIHCIAVRIDGFRTETVCGFGSKNIVIGVYVHYVQNAGRCYVGCNEDTVSGRTLCAVTRNGTHSEGFFANTLGQEGGGTAAVTVCCPLTAQRQHCFAFLVVTETNGVIGTAAVIHTDDERAVFLNADHGTGSSSGGALLGLGNQLAVLNDHAKGNANRMKQNTLCQILVKILFVIRLYVAGDVAFCIPEHVQNRGRRSIFALDTNILTVIHQNTGRIRIIIQVSVHTTDDVVAKVVLVILRHFGKFLMRPVCLIGQILIDLVVSGNDGYVGIRRVDLDYVENLSAGTVRIVEHDFGLNCSAGNQYVILFGDYVVVTVRSEAITVKNHVILCPIGDRGKHSQRHHADQHCYRNDHGYCTDCRFSHNSFPFC